MKKFKKISISVVLVLGIVLTITLVKARTFTSILPVANNTTGFTVNDSPAGNALSYTNNGNGTITDNVTGMIWQQDGSTAGTKTWADAITYCDGLSLGGQTDWRLPTQKELYSIVSFSSYNPTINTTYFTNTVNSYYWTSTTSPSSTANAFLVNFPSGHSDYTNKTSTYYIRCVR